jgi:glyoxalase family protein
MITQLHGIHHVTAVTANAPANLRFYTQVLGLRLVKKTVNQDDVSAYHLFYADKLGSPGTDMTFFDWAHTDRERRGTDSIAGTMFRVHGRAALDYWAERLAAHGVAAGAVETFAGRARLPFEDPEGQRLLLVDDGGAPFHGEVWDATDVPAEYAIRGFYGVVLSVPNLAYTDTILTRLLGFTAGERLPSPASAHETIAVYSMDGGGPGREVHVIEQPGLGRAWPGYGGVHHVAFCLADETEQQAWLERLHGAGVRTSGQVDRFYFKSLYFRISDGILFELATDGPGFATDEPLETMGQALALPPFLESRRAQIEAGLRPLETTQA